VFLDWSTSEEYFWLIMGSCHMQKQLTKHLLTMRYALFLLLASFLLGSLPTRAQTLPTPLVIDNSVWLDSVQHLALSQQVAAVQLRAWHDTLLAPYQMPLCRMGVSVATLSAAPTRLLPSPTKPRGFPLVYVVNGQAFYNNDAATIRQLQQALRSQPIRQVTLLRDVKAAAIYGSRGANGVVVLASAKAKHRE
jgi:TonB-dependent SusC/RagA subfamily outer membrane receptor